MHKLIGLANEERAEKKDIQMLKEVIYNQALPWSQARSEIESFRGLTDMMDVYSPFGQIRTVLCSFKSGMGIGGYQGTAVPLSLDHTLSRMLGISALSVGLDREIYGGGKGLNLSDSVASSLGEAVERMLGIFSSYTNSSETKTATAAEMSDRGLPIVGPDQYSPFTKEQFDKPGFGCVPWTDKTQVSWIKGKNLLTQEDLWVPEQYVHLFYSPGGSEPRIGASSSGGLATHYTEKRSLSHGLLELVERDGLNLAWFCKIPLTKLIIDAPFNDPQIERWLKTAERSGVKVDFYLHRIDMPEFYVVTASSVIPGLDAHSYLSGGGVGVDIESAMRSALAEVIQAERMVRTPLLSPEWELTKGFKRQFTVRRDASLSDFTNFIQVIDYYGFSENQKKLDWFLRNPDLPTVTLSKCHQEDSKSSVEDEYDRVLELYKKYNLTPVSFNFTPSEFDQIKLFKVFVPELTPAFPPNLPQLGHYRYHTIRRKLGIDDRDWTYADMPTDPLPYP